MSSKQKLAMLWDLSLPAWNGKNAPGGVGEIFAIYLLKEHQGKGWGKQLFLQAAERLRREGYESMMLWVLADNPTRGFYEAMGGSVSRQKDIEIGGDTLREVAYEWRHLDHP